MKTKTFFLFMFVIWILGCSDDEPTKNHQDDFILDVKFDQTMGKIKVAPENGPYSKGTKVNITAIPENGHVFKYWAYKDGTTTMENPLTVTMASDIEIEGTFEKNSGTDNQENEGLTLTVKYDTNQGKVIAAPSKTKYEFGETIHLEAIALEGFQFNYWKAKNITSNNEQLTLTLYDNIEISALFKKDNSENTAKPLFSVIGERTKKDDNYFFKVKVNFKPIKNENDHATLYINSSKVTIEQGEFTGNFEDMAPGSEFSLVLQHSSLPQELKAKIIVPENFGPDERLDFETKDNTIYLNWQKKSCDGHLLNHLIGNDGAQGEIAQLYPLDIIKNNNYAISTHDALYPPFVSIGTPKYYALSISPIAIYQNIEGFSSDSYILLKGTHSKWLTNHPNGKEYWGEFL